MQHEMTSIPCQPTPKFKNPPQVRQTGCKANASASTRQSQHSSSLFPFASSFFPQLSLADVLWPSTEVGHRLGRHHVQIVAPNSRNLCHEGGPNDLYPYDSERTGCIKANFEHNTSTPDTSLARANNETSSLYRQPKTRRPQNTITDEKMPESKHQAADGLLVAETRKNLEQLKDENTFFDPLLTPQQPFLLFSGVNQQSGMRCRRNCSPRD